MFTKRSVIALLVGLNLFLLAALVMESVPAPAAFGQAGARAGDFVCVTAKAGGQTYDVLYILDVPGRKLHALYPPSQRERQVVPARPRDLDKDFGG